MGDGLGRIVLVMMMMVYMGLGWLATPQGVHLSPDSVYYLNVAENLCAGRGWGQSVGLVPALTHQLQPMTVWPPLYPTILCVAQLLTGASFTCLAGAISLCCLGLLMPIAWKIGEYQMGRGTAWVSALLFLTSASLLETYSFAWTEPLYIVFTVAAAGMLWHWQKTGSDFGLWCAGILASLAAVTRYIGVVFITVSVVWVFLSSASFRRWTRAALFAAIALFPLGLWLGRNSLLVGELTGGNRAMSQLTFWENLTTLIQQLATDLLPWLGRYPIGQWGVVMGFVIVGVAKPPSLLTPTWRTFAYLYISGYLISLLFLGSWVQVDPIDTRLLTPIYPFVYLLFAHWVMAAYSHPRRKWVWGVVLIGGMLFIGGQVVAQRTLILSPPQWPYNALLWDKDETLAYVVEHLPPEAVIYTNMPALYVARTRRPAYLLPHPDNPVEQQQFWETILPQQPAFLVWHATHWEQPRTLPLAQLQQFCQQSPDCRQAIAFETGSIFHFR